MTDQSPNDLFHASSFLQGHNAEYIEQLYARYATDPNAVDEAWQQFFRQLGDTEVDAKRRRGRPVLGAGRLAAGAERRPDRGARRPMGGTREGRREDPGQGRREGRRDQDEQVRQAVLDSIRALMIIRAYRIRGHLAADLDPLGMREETPHPELDPRSYGFTEADMDRPIFIDNVLGLQLASMRQILDIVKRTYCGHLRAAVHAHLGPRAGRLAEGADRGLRQGDRLHPRGAPRDPEQARRGRGLREVPARQVHGHQALRP
jgi:2-oxoglutarate dehydrogenase E1 component